MTGCGKNKIKDSKVVIVGGSKRSRSVIGLIGLTELPVIDPKPAINCGTIGVIETRDDPESLSHSRQTYFPKKTNKKSKRDIFKKS